MELKNIPRTLACAAILLCSTHVFAGDTGATVSGTANASAITQTTPPNSHDVFTLDSTYTGASDVRDVFSRGKQDSTYTDINYFHRFPITGNWDLRLGVEYQRYDFSGPVAPLPNHLQGASAVVAYEYVVQDFPAVAVEMHPGFYFENNVTLKNFDVPTDAFTSFKLVPDKLFGMVGINYGTFIYPPLAGFGGVIWLINDKVRLQAVFPQPALIYDPNDDWECELDGGINGGGFRLDKSGRTPETYSDAALRYTYEWVGVLATYKKWKPFNVAIGAGYNIEREFDFIHYGPDQKYVSAGAPYVRISFSAKF